MKHIRRPPKRRVRWTPGRGAASDPFQALDEIKALRRQMEQRR